MIYLITIDYNYESKRIELDGIVSYRTFIGLCQDMFNFPDSNKIEISFTKSNKVHYIKSNKTFKNALMLIDKNEIEMLNLLIVDKCNNDDSENNHINEKNEDEEKGFISSFEEKWKFLTDQISDAVDSLDEKFQHIKDSIEIEVKAIISKISDNIFLPIIKNTKIKLDEFKRHVQNICFALIEKVKPQLISSSHQIEYKNIDSSMESNENILDDTHISLVLSDLNLLHEMGFTDEKHNLELMAKYPNDLDSVINELVNGES